MNLKHNLLDNSSYVVIHHGNTNTLKHVFKLTVTCSDMTEKFKQRIMRVRSYSSLVRQFEQAIKISSTSSQFRSQDFCFDMKWQPWSLGSRLNCCVKNFAMPVYPYTLILNVYSNNLSHDKSFSNHHTGISKPRTADNVCDWMFVKRKFQSKTKRNERDSDTDTEHERFVSLKKFKRKKTGQRKLASVISGNCANSSSSHVSEKHFPWSPHKKKRKRSRHTKNRGVFIVDNFEPLKEIQDAVKDPSLLKRKLSEDSDSNDAFENGQDKKRHNLLSTTMVKKCKKKRRMVNIQEFHEMLSGKKEYENELELIHATSVIRDFRYSQFSKSVGALYERHIGGRDEKSLGEEERQETGKGVVCENAAEKEDVIGTEAEEGRIGKDNVIEDAELNEETGPNQEVRLNEQNGQNEEIRANEENGPNEESGPNDEIGTNEETEPNEETAPNEEAKPNEKTGPNEESEPNEKTGPNEEAKPNEKTGPNEETEQSEETGPNEETEQSEETGPIEEARLNEETRLNKDAGPNEEIGPNEEAQIDEATGPNKEVELSEDTRPNQETQTNEKTGPIVGAQPKEKKTRRSLKTPLKKHQILSDSIMAQNPTIKRMMTRRATKRKIRSSRSRRLKNILT